MPALKAFLKAKDKDKINRVSQASCFLTISVGQATHEGDHLDKTLELVSNHFQTCVISINDRIQRHTMALHSHQDASYYFEAARHEGDLWLQRNADLLKTLKIPWRIHRWDDWLTNPQFIFFKRKILARIQENSDYQAAFHASAAQYTEKYIKRSTHKLSYERTYQLCMDFILEDCIGLCLWAQTNCDFELYPGAHNAAIEATRSHFLYRQNPELMIPLRIYFRNAKNLKPQFFYSLKQPIITPLYSY